MKLRITVTFLAILGLAFMGKAQENQPLYFTLYGKVTDLKTGKAVRGATVVLIPYGGISSKTTTDKKGVYSFEEIEGTSDSYILPNSNYTIKVSKKGYEPGDDELSTMGVEQARDFELDFILKKAEAEAK